MKKLLFKPKINFEITTYDNNNNSIYSVIAKCKNYCQSFHPGKNKSCTGCICKNISVFTFCNYIFSTQDKKYIDKIKKILTEKIHTIGVTNLQNESNFTKNLCVVIIKDLIIINSMKEQFSPKTIMMHHVLNNI